MSLANKIWKLKIAILTVVCGLTSRSLAQDSYFIENGSHNGHREFEFPQFNSEEIGAAKPKRPELDSLITYPSPKYEIYGRYFNPFALKSNEYRMEYAFKWRRRNFLYFTVDVIADRFAFTNYQKQIVSFVPNLRLTWKRVRWIHFETGGGFSLSHHKKNMLGGLMISDEWGAGFHQRQELQFDVGDVANISIGNYFAFQVTRFNRKNHYPPDIPPVISRGWEGEIYYSESSLIYVGFNIYLG